MSLFSSLSPIHKPADGSSAFDLVWLNGTDYRRTPLVERKAQLSEFVRRSRCPRLVYAQHIDGAGKQFIRESSARDLEGVVGKRKNGL
jgi:bifunctional non-homologous end joining protein LigD